MMLRHVTYRLSRGMAYLLLLPPLLLCAAGLGPVAAAYLGALWQWHSGAPMTMVCSWPRNAGVCVTVSSNPGTIVPEVDSAYYAPQPPADCPPMAVQYGCR